MNESAVILNSRQKLHPSGNEEWIRNSEKAVKYALEHGLTLLTSVGMNAWEIVLYLASKYRLRQKVYLPSDNINGFLDKCESLKKEFKLETALVEWCPVAVECPGQKGVDEFRKKRDRIIVADADMVIPVSIRKNGNLMQVIDGAESQGLYINRSFECSYDKRDINCNDDSDRVSIRSDIDGILSEYIIHWTRATHNPWPGEILYDYYKTIDESTDEYSHSARQTLMRILLEGMLRASAKHMRADIRAVSFSALEPSQAILLMKWRAHYREMTFEPYGIAIKKETAIKAGIRKVFYGNPEMYQYLDKGDQPYFQSIGTKGNWMPEKEYRFIGNFDFSAISRESMAVIVRQSREIDQLHGYFKGRILNIFDE